MSKRSNNVQRLKMPYTSAHAVPDVGHQVYGYTYEYAILNDLGGKDVEEPEWGYRWEQHDLGIHENLEEARAVASEWRASLVGQYEVK